MDGDAFALPTGTVLSDGRYEIAGVLGRGGFGITYRADDRRLGRDVAVKEFFMSGSSRDGTTVRVPDSLRTQVDERSDRVRAEARVLARFRHPGIVTVHELFEDNGTVYVVMELVEGASMREIVDRAGGPLPEHDVIAYGRRIAEALGAVHERHLLHRDVKPDNVIVMPDGAVVLVDFGTARDFETDESSTMSRTLSPGYAPVEQYTGRARFGPSTDLYALGATMYHLATGVVPTGSLDHFVGHDLAPPRSVNPELSEHTSRAILWAMHVDAADRPQSADAFVAVLDGDEVPTADPNATRPSARSVDPPPRPPAGGEVAPAPDGPARPRRSRSRRLARRAGRSAWNIAVMLAIAILATLVVAWLLDRGSDDGGLPADVTTGTTDGTASPAVDPTRTPVA